MKAVRIYFHALVAAPTPTGQMKARPLGDRDTYELSFEELLESLRREPVGATGEIRGPFFQVVSVKEIKEGDGLIPLEGPRVTPEQAKKIEEVAEPLGEVPVLEEEFTNDPIGPVGPIGLVGPEESFAPGHIQQGEQEEKSHPFSEKTRSIIEENSRKADEKQAESNVINLADKKCSYAEKH